MEEDICSRLLVKVHKLANASSLHTQNYNDKQWSESLLCSCDGLQLLSFIVFGTNKDEVSLCGTEDSETMFFFIYIQQTEDYF